MPTFNLLNDNLKLNNITNVNSFNIGLSNNIGKALLNTSLYNNGLNTLGSNPLRFNDITTVEIVVDTLDNIFYINNISVDFIKIDTEGWEYNILKGGINTIKKYKPYIQLKWIEINMKQCDININEFTNFIKNELDYIVDHIINEELYIKYSYNK
jgi:FkbM family methyltransferase